MKISLIIIFCIISHSVNANVILDNSQKYIADSINNKSRYLVEITPSKYTVAIPRGTVTIKLIETGETVYEVENCFEFPEERSGILHVDLDKDGNKEVIVYGQTGGTAGFINVFIFDFEKSFMPLYSIYTVAYDGNRKIDDYLIDNNEFIEIIIGGLVGSGATKEIFYFPLRYTANGIEISFDSDNEFFLDIANKNLNELLNKIKKFKSSDCSKDNLKYPFEASYIQNVFLNNEQIAEEILNKYYKCKDKSNFKMSIKNELEKILDLNKYKFNEQNY